MGICQRYGIALLLLLSACSRSQHDVREGTVTAALLGTERGIFETNKTAGVSADAPPARGLSSLAFDAVHGQTVVFGGLGESGVLSDTWEWNGTSWSENCTAPPCAAPSGRFRAAMAFDTAHGVSVLFGGMDDNGDSHCDTWEWDHSAWTQREPSTSCGDARPSNRFGHAMASAGDEGILVFGGISESDGYTNDLWQWKDRRWTRLCSGCDPDSLPKSRYDGSLVYGNGVLLLFGGADGDGTPLQDLWKFDFALGKWSELCTAPACSPQPSARFGHAAAFDTFRGRMVMHGGITDNTEQTPPSDDAYEWDGTSWSPTSPGTPKSSSPMVFDSIRRRTVEFGGYGPFSQPLLADTVEYHTRGAACSSGNTCDTSNCVDGVCCEKADCGTCSRCNDPSKPGECAPVTGAEDPDTCAAPLTCDPTGRCSKKLGEACTESTDCASSFCADGYCCNEACDGECRTCSATPGTCTAVATGQTDPKTCDAAMTACAADGSCKYVTGAACRLPEECVSGHCADGFCCTGACDGSCAVCSRDLGATADGVCTNLPKGRVVSDTLCREYACSGGKGCLTECATSADCARDYYCDEQHRCTQQKKPGDDCDSLEQCSTNHCSPEGKCCTTACDGPCEACNDKGECKFTDTPAAGHRGCGAGPCAGHCDSSLQGCAYPGSATPCSGAQCLNDWRIPAGVCDGSGACSTNSPESCDVFSCDSQRGACNTECTLDTDCRLGAVCDSTQGSRGTCRAVTAQCSEDLESIVLEHGDPVFCRGYLCTGGSCAFKACNDAGDCAHGYFCTNDHRCLLDPNAPPRKPPTKPDAGPRDAGPGDGDANVDDVRAAQTNSVGCSVSGAGSSTERWAALLMAGLAVLSRRAGRSRSRHGRARLLDG